MHNILFNRVRWSENQGLIHVVHGDHPEEGVTPSGTQNHKRHKNATMLMDSLEYFKKSYFAVDGLWFLMIEEHTSFENALDIDKKVWKIMAKIQARTAKSLGKSFIEGLCLKWDSEGYSYDIKRNLVDIGTCPWWNIMKKSGRDHKGGKIGSLICPIIYNGWAEEYNVPYTIAFETHICQGDEHCRLRFKKQSVE